MSILVYISGGSCFSGITTYNIPTFLTLVLIRGGLISQKNVGTATLSQGGAYMPVNTVAKKHSNGTLADPIKSYTAATRMLLELPRNRLVHSVGD